VFAWIFFRAENINHAFNYIKRIFSFSLFKIPRFPGRTDALKSIILVFIFVIIEWQGRHGKYGIENIAYIKQKYMRTVCYYVLVLTIIILGNFNENSFIYFQF
jgi:hypothetical protein